MLSRQEISVGVPDVLADLKRDLSELTQTVLTAPTGTTLSPPKTAVNDLDLLRSTIRRLEERQIETEARVADLEIQLSKLQSQNHLVPFTARTTPQTLQRDSLRSSSATKIKNTMRAVGFLGQPPPQQIRPLRFIETAPAQTMLAAQPMLHAPQPMLAAQPLISAQPVLTAQSMLAAPTLSSPIVAKVAGPFTEQVANSAPPASSFQDRVSAIKALVLNNQVGDEGGQNNCQVH